VPWGEPPDPLPPEPPEPPPPPDVVVLVVEVLLVVLVALEVLEEPPGPDVLVLLPPPEPPMSPLPAMPVVVPAVAFDPPSSNASASSSTAFAHAPELAKNASPTRLNPQIRRIFYESMSFASPSFNKKHLTSFAFLSGGDVRRCKVVRKRERLFVKVSMGPCMIRAGLE
jgi:hypothetical protein